MSHIVIKLGSQVNTKVGGENPPKSVNPLGEETGCEQVHMAWFWLLLGHLILISNLRFPSIGGNLKMSANPPFEKFGFAHHYEAQLA